MIKQLLLSMIILIAFTCAIKTQDAPTIPSVSYEYEPAPGYPFGRLNPTAPPETKQFDFLIGEFDCDDRIMNPQNGQWFNMKAFRRAAYIMNGYAIQEGNWTPIVNTAITRAYNPKTKQWEISAFQFPNFSSGIWKGGKEGENLVFRFTKGKTTSRTTYFDIAKDSYNWKAESITNGKAVLRWEITCKRKTIGNKVNK